MSHLVGHVVTITEHTPTEDGTDVNSYHVICESFFDALEVLKNAELNFAVFINASITPIRS